MDFRDECNEWLNPLGYTIHTSGGNREYYVFTKHIGDTTYAPAIECSIIKGEKKARLVDSSNYKLFLTLDSGYIQFKHPDMKHYIKVFEHYGRLVTLYPPF